MNRTERLSFTGALGEPVAARLELPEAEPRAFALFAHCFTCTKEYRAPNRISRKLAEQGFAVLRFDFSGLGQSGGSFEDTNFSSSVADLVSAAHFLRQQYRAPNLLIGHSLGGTAVLAAASSIAEVRAVVTIGSPCDPGHVRRLFAASAPEIEQQGEAEVDIAGRRFKIKRHFLEDLEKQDLNEAIRDLRKALMIFHSPVDNVVGIDHAERIFLAARHPKSFVSLNDADHLLSREADADSVGEIIAAWAPQYLPDQSSPEPEPGHVHEEGTVVVHGGKGLAQEIHAGSHRLVADEPKDVGGTETGPTPYDLLLAALGACTSMTLRLYADRKGWPLEATDVKLQHSKIHAADCNECQTKEGKLDHIARELDLHGPLSDEQRTRLLEIANKCPVHRTLESEIHVSTRLSTQTEGE